MRFNIFVRKSRTLLKMLACRVIFPFYKHHGTPQVLSIADTLKLVIKHKMSVARFGDGEYYHLVGISTGMQHSQVELQAKLKETILNRNPRLLVCMVDYLEQKNLSAFTKLAYSYHYVCIYKTIKQYVDADYRYGNSNMTRFYIGASDKSNCGLYFNLCKQIWDGVDVVIFEGDKTRFGVRNDLLENAKSVRRILCPSKHSFNYYHQIVSEAKTFDKNCLLLFALGISATVAASDLTNEGYWVIDIGHLDVEYEWYKSGAIKKVAIKGKVVSEVDGGMSVEEISDEIYLAQIVGKIGIED